MSIVFIPTKLVNLKYIKVHISLCCVDILTTMLKELPIGAEVTRFPKKTEKLISKRPIVEVLNMKVILFNRNCNSLANCH